MITEMIRFEEKVVIRQKLSCYIHQLSQRYYDDDYKFAEELLKLAVAIRKLKQNGFEIFIPKFKRKEAMNE